MAVVNTLSTTVANYNAQPRILTSGYLAGANDTVCTSVVQLGAGDSIASTYRMGFISSGVLIEDIKIVNDATTAGTFQIGLYNNTQQPCTVVVAGVVTTSAPGAVPVTNANVIFGTGVTTGSAKTTWTSVYAPTILAATITASNVGLRLWELLGLDADPFYEFHLVLTATVAVTAAGKLGLQYSWVR